jgi:hypothetical protein
MIQAMKSTEEMADLARAALSVAAMRRTTLTYSELAKIVGIEGVPVSHHMPRVLAEVSRVCKELDEPALDSLVVRAKEGDPGAGHMEGADPWFTEVRRVYAHWGKFVSQ